MLAPRGCLSPSSVHELSTGGEVFTPSSPLICSFDGAEESCHGTDTTLDGELVLCGTISNDPGASEDDPLCFQSTEGDVQDLLEQLN